MVQGTGGKDETGVSTAQRNCSLPVHLCAWMHTEKKNYKRLFFLAGMGGGGSRIRPRNRSNTGILQIL